MGEECEIREPLFLREGEKILPNIFAYLSEEKETKVFGYGDMGKAYDYGENFGCGKNIFLHKGNGGNTFKDTDLGIH